MCLSAQRVTPHESKGKHRGIASVHSCVPNSALDFFVSISIYSFIHKVHM